MGPYTFYPKNNGLLAVNHETSQIYSVKAIEKKKLEKKQLQDISSQLELAPLISHKNISCVSKAIEDETNLYLLYDSENVNMDSNLLDYVSKRGRLCEEDARVVFHQIVSAVHHCHTHQVVHRDLKLPLIRVNSSSKCVQLSDFKEAKVLDSPKQLLTDRKGSPAYVCPEIVKGEPYLGQQADVWSLGVILYTMLHGVYPFRNKDPRALFEHIIDPNQPADVSNLSPTLANLLSLMLNKNASRRISTDDILKHAWFRSTVKVEVHEADDDQLVPVFQNTVYVC